MSTQRGIGKLRRAFYANPTAAVQDALEDFIRQGEQRQRGRAHVGRTRRMVRSNVKYARRPEGWREWVTALVNRRLPRHASKPIPVHLRPGVPRVDATLGYPEQRDAILKEAKRLLPGHQFKEVYGRWQEGIPEAETRAQWQAKRSEFLRRLDAQNQRRVAA